MESLNWSEYGLLGLVLGAFMVVVTKGFTQLVDSIRELHKQTALEREQRVAEHREEREKWLEANLRGQERVATSVDKLTDEIRMYGRRGGGE